MSYNLEKELLMTGGLCPNCDSKIKKAGDVMKITYPNKEEELVYLICRNCAKKRKRLTEVRLRNSQLKINDRLENQFSLYAAKVINEDHFENILSRKNEKSYLKELPVDNVWNESDRLFFEENPDIKYRARRVFKGELEEVYGKSEEKRTEALTKNINFAIIHQIAKGQRVRSYVGGLDNEPYNDEAYVAALFLVMLSPVLNETDIPVIFQEIKERKRKIEDLGLDFTKIYKQGDES
jgi:hypothetical protein